MSEHADRIRAVVDGYPLLRGLDPDVIYTIHVSSTPAPLLRSDLLALLAELTRLEKAGDQLAQALTTRMTGHDHCPPCTQALQAWQAAKGDERALQAP